jgi:diguanylate cyclase (GGDEF)-like protein
MEEIRHRAMHDDLTGLPNRILFADRIEQAILTSHREERTPVVLLLDVNRFKEINNTLGHELGDELLQDLGSRLRNALRANETLARLGGDEFGILLPAGSLPEAQTVADRVHAALHDPFVLSDLPLEISASIGIASHPEHGEHVEALIQHADVAMYVAKERNSNTGVYDPAEDTNDALRLALAGELRRAIEEEELVVYFQPKAELASGRIIGAEALVRWQHPARGFIPPSDFIPIAERTGLIKPLSRLVLQASVKQCAAWKSAGRDLQVSVNLTVPDLLDLDLPERIGALLADSALPPDQLELEITETTLLSDPFRVRDVLNRLNEMGVRLAIDDFGTGYSSLAYLKRLPVQTLKIDRSFVMEMCSDPNDATIVRSTLELGRNLGLETVAEGVESQEIWNALQAQGCTLAQGYFISRPVPAAEFDDVLAAYDEPQVARTVSVGA